MTEVNFALAPAGATHYDFFNGDLCWLKYDRAWLFFDNGEWAVCEHDEQPTNVQEIPAREIKLNRLADTYNGEGYTPHGVTHDGISTRRTKRIEAGLVEVENPITSSLTNSQVKEMELDMLKQEHEQWLPRVGELCEVAYHPQSERWWPNAELIAKDGEWLLFKREGKNKPLIRTAETVRFRPIKTQEQKDREAFALAAEKASGLWDFGEYFTAHFAYGMYDWLTKNCVDLSPLTKGDK